MMDASPDELTAAQPDYLPLLAALRIAKGFALLLAECNVPVLRERILDALEKDCGREIVRVDLREALKDPDRGVTIDEVVADAARQAGEEAVISVSGLEAGLPGDDPDRTDRTLQEINFRRGAFQRLGKPLLLWLPQYAMTLLARHAPDLHDWYSGAFVFADQELTRPIEYRPLDWVSGVPQNLTIEEKHRHLETLASLLKTAQQAGDEYSQANILYDQAGLEETLGQYDVALEHYDAAKTILERLGIEAGIATTLGQIANIYYLKGKLEDALRIATDEALPVYNKLGDARGVAITKGKIADILAARGQLDEALRIRMEEVLPEFEKVGDVRGVALSKGRIADIFVARGQLDEALRIRVEEVLPVYEQIGDLRNMAVTKGYIADIFYMKGNFEAALKIRINEQIPIYEQIGDLREVAITNSKIADILQARGQLDESLLYLQDALKVAEEMGDLEGIAWTSSRIAKNYLFKGNIEGALKEFVKAYNFFIQTGYLNGIALVGETYGRALFESGHKKEGLAILQRSLDGFRQLGRNKSVARVEALIKRLSSQ